MFEIKDFSDWIAYEGFTEGSGRSEKRWIQSPNGVVGLFKWPKTEETYEYISEHMSHQIGEYLNIPTASVDLGKLDGRIGSVSYLVNEENEELHEGAEFIIGLHPNYNLNTLYDSDTNKFYSIENIMEVIRYEKFSHFWIEMMFFDFLIGNSDRHQNNWAILSTVDIDAHAIRIRPCPLYDNGSSLCCYVKDTQIEEYLGKDIYRINALVDTKSRSLIRINPRNKKTPKHSEVVAYLLRNYNYSYEVADLFLSRMDENYIDQLVYSYNEDVLGEQRKRLISRFLKEKIKLLHRLVEEATDEKRNS